MWSETFDRLTLKKTSRHCIWKASSKPTHSFSLPCFNLVTLIKQVLMFYTEPPGIVVCTYSPHAQCACTVYVFCVCYRMHPILCLRGKWQVGKLTQDVSMHDSEVRAIWHHQGARVGILWAGDWRFLFVIKNDVISEINHKECTCSVYQGCC